MFADFLVDGVASSAIDGEFKVETSVVRKLNVLRLVFGESLALKR